MASGHLFLSVGVKMPSIGAMFIGFFTIFVLVLKHFSYILYYIM